MLSPKTRVELEKKGEEGRYSNCSNNSSDSGDEWTHALETSVMKTKKQMMDKTLVGVLIII